MEWEVGPMRMGEARVSRVASALGPALKNNNLKTGKGVKGVLPLGHNDGVGSGVK